MTFARAKLVPPDDGRFSLSAIGLGDWSLSWPSKAKLFDYGYDRDQLPLWLG
jgi:hypothetical protein